ncbi:alpha/beta hydrolase [Altericista sp. CCNU0014]|uniref:alpha/beta hydrolase n=1 Tax=Altericista sp. CCNU0014 TaxID=3082949 RepID=UPI003850D66F
MKKLTKQRMDWRSYLGGCSFAMGLMLTCAVDAAERVHATYGFIEITLPVSDLEVYAQEGRLSPTLKTYSKFLKPAQLADLREALKKRIELSPDVISQFLYTPTGEKMLERASTLVKAKSQVSSLQALRSAMILASTDPQGLTVLSLMRNYPDSGIQLDVAQGIEVFQSIRKLVQQTNTSISLVQQRSDRMAMSSPAARPAELLNLRKSGPYAWDVIPLTLTDKRPRRVQLSGPPREFAADAYVPNLVRSAPMPIAVISHGLGSGRTAFKYFAEHLASHGFVVAVPEHPGSSDRQISALLDGKADDVSNPKEFIDRPLDVSYLLDELSRLNQTDERLKGRLDLDRVGVMGQSFGGYTALALVGAKINFESLQKGCDRSFSQSLNLSLLLQCQAQQLPKQDYAFKDPRVKAAIAVNPSASTVFGLDGFKGVQAPVMLISGTADSITPPLAEQIEPFTWLPDIEKHLILIDGATHFSTIDRLQPTERAFVTPKELIGRTPEVARIYMRALGLAFFQAYVKKQPHAAAFLNPASIQAQSTQPLLLRGISSLSIEELDRIKDALW